MKHCSLLGKVAVVLAVSSQLAPSMSRADRAPSSATAQNKCQATFAGPSFTPIEIKVAEETGITVNGIAVTGPDLYPTEEVLKNLNITPAVAESWRVSGKKVFSIGEGTGGLLPWLLQSGVRAWGVDLWYHQREPFPDNERGRRMTAYQKEFGSHLIRGDALNLKMKNDSVDVIVSNKLINNLEMPQKMQFLVEILRVLKPGAEARLDYVTHHEAVKLFDELNERFPNSRIFEFNIEGEVGSVGLLPEAGFQITRDYESGVLTILKRRPFSQL